MRNRSALHAKNITKRGNVPDSTREKDDGFAVGNWCVACDPNTAKLLLTCCTP